MLRTVALVALCGCSLVLVEGPPPPPPPPAQVSCTTSAVVPILDTVVSAAALGTAIYFAASNSGHAELGGSIGAGIAIGFGISAVTGWRRTSRCRAAVGH